MPKSRARARAGISPWPNVGTPHGAGRAPSATRVPSDRAPSLGRPVSSTCAHLHVHSEYSLLDGACKIDKLAERAAAFGQPALGLTDHGVMNGAVELYKATKKHGIKPIIGLEAYFVDDRRVKDRKVERNHLTLLAENDEGYRNLVKLSSKGFLEGLHRGKPGVDLELLGEHSAGVIALTGCLASRSSQRIVAGKPDDARAHLDELVHIFGPEQVYFEVQRNGIAEQEQVNEAIKRFGAEMGRPLVATADVHYLRKEDYHHHAALLCVQTKSTLAAPKMSFDTNEFYLKSTDEMVEAFADMPGAVAASLEIAERCDCTIELGKQLIPRFDCPEGLDEKAYLRRLVEDGMRARYGDPLPAAAVERMEMELAVIDKMGFNAYFLIVWDFVNYAKSNGIAVGPGRGSAAGSIVAYSLTITDVDPLRYDLLFERFLNAERVSMPDIDIDFSVRGRERVIRYVTEKYGAERVAQIITFGKMFPRAATRDAARVLGHEYAIGDKLAKLIPDPQQGRPPSFEDCLQPGHRARQRGRARRHRQADRRRRAGPRGDRPQRLDPRGRRGHLRPAADRHRPAAARRRGHRPGRPEDPPHGHAVLDEARRGARPAQDGLPGPAQPRRDRGRAGHHRALGGGAAEHGRAAARRRQDLRDDGRGRLDRRVPVRVRGHARGAAADRADRVRGPRRARGALPPGRHGPDPDLRARQAQPGRDRLHRRAPALDHRLHQGRDPLPGAGDADRQGPGRLLGPEGGRPAQGDRQEEPRRDGRAATGVLPGLPGVRHERGRHRDAVGDQREVRRLLVQQVPRRLLRADLLPDRVAEGQLPVRVHGRADLLGHGHEGQGAVLRQPGGGDGHRDPAAGRQRVRPRVHGRRRQHPLRARRRQGRRLRRGRGDQARPRGGRSVRVPVGLLRARRRPRGQQEGDRGADQVRRLRLHRRDAQGDARGARGRAGRRAEVPAGRPDRPGLDLRPRARRRRRRSPRRRTRRSRRSSSSARSCWRSRRSRSASSSPSTRSSACARRSRSGRTARAPR